MDSFLYKEKLKGSLEAYFDVCLDKEIHNDKFDLYASYNQRNAKYMLVKSAEIYAFKNDEYVFYKHFNKSLALSDIEEIREYLENNIDNIVNVDKEHMCSIINFVVTVDSSVDEESLKSIKKFKFHKSFKFGFNGWVDVRLIIVDLERDELYCNKFAKKDGDKFLFKN